jgi:hypothetical protein
VLGVGAYALTFCILPYFAYALCQQGAWMPGGLALAGWVFLIIAWQRLKLARHFS